MKKLCEPKPEKINTPHLDTPHRNIRTPKSGREVLNAAGEEREITFKEVADREVASHSNKGIQGRHWVMMEMNYLT